MRNDVHTEAISRNFIDGEAHPIEGDRALWGNEFLQASGRLESETNGLGLGPPLNDASDAVNMASNEVSAKFVTDAQGFFEVHGCSLLPVGDRRARQRLRRGLDREFSLRGNDHRQADPGTCDRSPEWNCRGVERGGDRQIDEITAA